MTREEAIHKMEYSKRAYQMLIDEKVQEGVLVGQGINAEWSADTPIIDAYKDMLEACDMAIKALEQEPCGDAISRQAVLDAIEELKKIHFDRVVVLNKVRDRTLELPPVNPQEPCGEIVSLEAFKQVMWERDIAIGQLKELGYGFGQKIESKTGHWIDMTSGYAFNDKCSECGYIVHIQFINEYKYCPNCGARMESEE